MGVDLGGEAGELPVIHILLQDLGAPRIALLLELTDGVYDPILAAQAPQHLVVLLDGEHNVFEEAGEAANEVGPLGLGCGRLLRELGQVLKLETGAEGDDLLEIGDVDLEALLLKAKRREDLDEAEDGGVVALVHRSSKALAGDGLHMALDVEELSALLIIAVVRAAAEAAVDLEEVVYRVGGGMKIVDCEGAAGSVEAAGAVKGGIDEVEGVADAGLGEVEVADAAADAVSEFGSGASRGEEEGCVGAGEVEEVGGAGAGKGDEVAVEVRALGEEGLEAEVEGALVGDALVEEAGHGAHVRERSYQIHRLRIPKVHSRHRFRRRIGGGPGGGFVLLCGGHRERGGRRLLRHRRGDDRHRQRDREEAEPRSKDREWEE